MSWDEAENFRPKRQSSRTKKIPFTQSEKDLLTELVSEWSILENKSTKSHIVFRKKKAWLELSMAFNAQSYTLKRTDFQLKRCWENMKTARKRELAIEAQEADKTGVGSPTPHASPETVDKICPSIYLTMPDATDSNSEYPPDTSRLKKLDTEAEVRLDGLLRKNSHEEEIHLVRMKREQVLLERNEVLLEKEKQELEFQRQMNKIKLEKALL